MGIADIENVAPARDSDWGEHRPGRAGLAPLEACWAEPLGCESASRRHQCVECVSHFSSPRPRVGTASRHSTSGAPRGALVHERRPGSLRDIRRSACNPRRVPESPEANCSCGLVVIAPHDLDEVGLCVVCAGSGHDWGCACFECAVYIEESDAGAFPTEALERVLTSAEKRA